MIFSVNICIIVEKYIIVLLHIVFLGGINSRKMLVQWIFKKNWLTIQNIVISVLLNVCFLKKKHFFGAFIFILTPLH